MEYNVFDQFSDSLNCCPLSTTYYLQYNIDRNYYNSVHTIGCHLYLVLAHFLSPEVYDIPPSNQ